MENTRWIDKGAWIVALLTFIFSWWWFAMDTSMWSKSLFASLLSSGLAFSTYVLVRWLILAIFPSSE